MAGCGSENKTKNEIENEILANVSQIQGQFESFNQCGQYYANSNGFVYVHDENGNVSKTITPDSNGQFKIEIDRDSKKTITIHRTSEYSWGDIEELTTFADISAMNIGKFYSFNNSDEECGCRKSNLTFDGLTDINYYTGIDLHTDGLNRKNFFSNPEPVTLSSCFSKQADLMITDTNNDRAYGLLFEIGDDEIAVTNEMLVETVKTEALLSDYQGYRVNSHGYYQGDRVFSNSGDYNESTFLATSRADVSLAYTYKSEVESYTAQEYDITEYHFKSMRSKLDSYGVRTKYFYIENEAKVSRPQALELAMANLAANEVIFEPLHTTGNIATIIKRFYNEDRGHYLDWNVFGDSKSALRTINLPNDLAQKVSSFQPYSIRVGHENSTDVSGYIQNIKGRTNNGNDDFYNSEYWQSESKEYFDFRF